MEIDSIQTDNLEVDGQSSGAGSNPNLFINGQFDIWQRGTSVTGPISTTYSCADRWIFYDGNGTADVSRQPFTPGQTDVPAGPKYYAEYDMTVQATSGGPGIYQRIESVKTASSEPITLSFYAKLASGTLVVTPFVSQNFGATGSATVNTDYSSQTITLTSTWTLHTVTLQVPSITGKTISGGGNYLQVGFKFPLSSGTFTLSLANVKVEHGSIATPYQRINVGEELALCQRYYYEKAIEDWRIAGNGTGTTIRFQHDHPVQMRAIPTITKTASNANNSTYGSVSGVTVDSFYSVWVADATNSAVGINSLEWTADVEL